MLVFVVCAMYLHATLGTVVSASGTCCSNAWHRWGLLASLGMLVRWERVRHSAVKGAATRGIVVQGGSYCAVIGEYRCRHRAMGLHTAASVLMQIKWFTPSRRTTRSHVSNVLCALHSPQAPPAPVLHGACCRDGATQEQTGRLASQQNTGSGRPQLCWHAGPS